MDALINYFQNIPSLHRTIFLAGGITVFWLVESIIPLFHFTYNKWKHAAINIFFTLTTIVVNFAFAVLIVLTSNWCINNHFGLLQWMNLSTWLVLVLGLLFMDFIGAYCIHLIEHKVKWMWKFHMVHHADTHVDTTTANRHHPGESVFRAVFAIIAVLLLGAPIWLFMLYQTLSAVLSQFNHANIKMGARFDKVLGFIIVTPNMHRIHHHFMRPQTDSNYGNIFPFWDRLFGTYNATPVEQIQYGLDVLKDKNDESLSLQLKIPFDRSIKTDY